MDAKQAELARIGNTAPLQMCDPLWNLPPPMQEQYGIMPFDQWVEAVIPIFKDLVAKLGDGPYFGGAKPGYGECYTWHNVDVSFKIAKPELTKALGAAMIQKLEARPILAPQTCVLARPSSRNLRPSRPSPSKPARASRRPRLRRLCSLARPLSDLPLPCVPRLTGLVQKVCGASRGQGVSRPAPKAVRNARKQGQPCLRRARRPERTGKSR